MSKRSRDGDDITEWRAKAAAADERTAAAVAAAAAAAAAASAALAAANKRAADAEAATAKAQAAAAAAAVAAAAAAAADVNCSICLDVFELPTALPRCAHVFCRGCLAQAVEKRKLDSECALCAAPVFDAAERARLLAAGTSAADAVRKFPELLVLRGACELARKALDGGVVSSSLASSRLLRLLAAHNAIADTAAAVSCNDLLAGITAEADAQGGLLWHACRIGLYDYIKRLLAKGARTDAVPSPLCRWQDRNWLPVLCDADITTTVALVDARLKTAGALADIRAAFDLTKPSMKLVLLDAAPALVDFEAKPIAASDSRLFMALGRAYVERLAKRELK